MNIGLVITLFIVIFVLIIISGIMSSSDIVYLVVNKLRLKKDIEKTNSKTSKIALSMSEQYDKTLPTILFTNNLVNIAATSLSTVLAKELFVDSTIGVEGGTTIMSVSLLIILLLFGEIIPKVLGRAFSYPLSKLLAYPLRGLYFLFYPVVFLSSCVGKFFAYPFIHNKKKDESAVSNEELQEMVDTIEDEGVIDEEQGELLNKAIIFKDTEAHEIMTPRVDVFAIDINSKVEDLLKTDDIFTHSRVPVYEHTIDNIVGMLSTKALLRKVLAHQETNIASLIVSPTFVPGSMGISEILDSMQSTKNHIVIVKDEYGGTDGVLTMEDILEELVGDMWDEMDEVKEPYKKLKRNLYEIDGNMNIDDFFDLVDVSGPQEQDYESVGGFVIDLLERFAKPGDKVNYQNLKFEVIATDEFTVERVLVKVGRKKNV